MSIGAMIGMPVEAVVCMANDAGLSYSFSEADGAMWLTLEKGLMVEIEFESKTREIIDASYI